MRYEIRAVLAFGGILALLVALIFCAGCGTTVHGEEGVTLKREQASIHLFPACPTLPADPVAAKEITLAWLQTLKDIAGSLPAGLHAEITATIDRSTSGQLSTATDVRSEIQASVQEAFKDFYKAPIP